MWSKQAGLQTKADAMPKTVNRMATLAGACEVIEVNRSDMSEESTHLALNPTHARQLLATILIQPFSKKKPINATLHLPDEKKSVWVGHACDKAPINRTDLALEKRPKSGEYPVYSCELRDSGYEVVGRESAIYTAAWSPQDAIDALIRHSAQGNYGGRPVWMPLDAKRSVFLYADTPKWLGEEGPDGQPKPLGYQVEDDTYREYLLVSDTTSEVMKSSASLNEMREMVELIRKAGGSATVFKSMNI